MATHTIDWNQTPPDVCQACVVTLGNFDGVHLGHASLLEQTQHQARSIETAALAVTFDPHPGTLLRPEQPLYPLTTISQRVALLKGLGVQHVVVLKTTPSLLALGAEEFFSEVLVDRFRVRALVEGANFGFGRNREGDVQTLQQLCSKAKIALTIAPPEHIGGEPVSSSRVRQALLHGHVEEARNLLGRPYRIEGEVGEGQKRGRQIGFPTANLERVPTLLPADGVYAVRCLYDGDRWAGAANIGSNPTFGENERKIEVHLIEFEGDLYGERLAIDFVERLRETRPFGSKEELTEQLQRDIADAKRSVRPDS